MLEDLIRKTRSCRRFYQHHMVSHDTLTALVNLARLSASASNLQPIKYILSCSERVNADIFSCLGWAGYLPDWPGPAEGERPAAYIIMLHDTTISSEPGCDHGIAAQSMMLGARETGLGSCMIGSIDRNRLRDILDIPPHLNIPAVIALGKPKETIVLETIGTEESIRYWRDDQGIHHVPKRKLNDIILNRL
ncbi:MAG: nitroreductase family protein [Desulfobacterales bacterium]|nr:nitroreductase family protein [Desulfobacterales bacterium]